MLGGYNYFRDSKEPLLIHEGIFDMFRSVLRKYNAVCAFGKVLSAKQIALINATAASEIVLCLDGDDAGIKGMWNIIKKWKKHIAKPLSMMYLPSENDPDSCPKNNFVEKFDCRREIN